MHLIRTWHTEWKMKFHATPDLIRLPMLLVMLLLFMRLHHFGDGSFSMAIKINVERMNDMKRIKSKYRNINCCAGCIDAKFSTHPKSYVMFVGERGIFIKVRWLSNEFTNPYIVSNSVLDFPMFVVRPFFLVWNNLLVGPKRRIPCERHFSKIHKCMWQKSLPHQNEIYTRSVCCTVSTMVPYTAMKLAKKKSSSEWCQCLDVM